jgi:Kef-type K+ transport system membrane component KefB
MDPLLVLFFYFSPTYGPSPSLTGQRAELQFHVILDCIVCTAVVFVLVHTVGTYYEKENTRMLGIRSTLFILFSISYLRQIVSQ